MANDLTIAASNCRVLQQEFACAHLNPREAGLCCEHLALGNCSNLVARMLSCLSGGHGMGSILCEVELKKKKFHLVTQSEFGTRERSWEAKMPDVVETMPPSECQLVY